MTPDDPYEVHDFLLHYIILLRVFSITMPHFPNFVKFLRVCIFNWMFAVEEEKNPCFTNHIFDYLILTLSSILNFFFYPFPLSVKERFYDTI